MSWIAWIQPCLESVKRASKRTHCRFDAQRSAGRAQSAFAVCPLRSQTDTRKLPVDVPDHSYTSPGAVPPPARIAPMMRYSRRFAIGRSVAQGCVGLLVCFAVQRTVAAE